MKMKTGLVAIVTGASMLLAAGCATQVPGDAGCCAPKCGTCAPCASCKGMSCCKAKCAPCDPCNGGSCKGE